MANNPNENPNQTYLNNRPINDFFHISGNKSTNENITFHDNPYPNLSGNAINRAVLVSGDESRNSGISFGSAPSIGPVLRSQVKQDVPYEKEPQQQPLESYYLGDKTGAKIRGLALVLSYEEFQVKSLNRLGNSNDLAKIEETFNLQDFNVIVQKDKNKQETLDILDEVSKNPDNKVYSCFILVIMSHGDETGFLCQNADGPKDADGKVPYQTMFDYFHQKNENIFRGKPKLFFIQSCLGDRHDNGIDLKSDGQSVIQSDALSETKNPNPNIIPQTADTFAFYSSFNSYKSFRDELVGSWFIQSLCSNINEFENEELTHICKRVIEQVSGREAKDGNVSYKQLPKFESNMHKQFYFCKKVE